MANSDSSEKSSLAIQKKGQGSGPHFPSSPTFLLFSKPRFFVFYGQNELDQVSQLYEIADTKASTLSKRVQSLESQLSEAQDSLQEETKQKLALQSRIRDQEEKHEMLQDQLDEEEEQKRNVERQLLQATQSVRVTIHSHIPPSDLVLPRSGGLDHAEGASVVYIIYSMPY